MRSELDDKMMAVAELCARLRHTAPDLTPSQVDDSAGELTPRQDNPDAVLERAKTALREAELATTATTRAAQRPTLLPKAHHVLRELLVYGSCMIACLLVQFVYFAVTGGDSDSKWWVTFLLPVMATIVGYVLVGTANRPRLPLLEPERAAHEPAQLASHQALGPRGAALDRIERVAVAGPRGAHDVGMHVIDQPRERSGDHEQVVEQAERSDQQRREQIDRREHVADPEQRHELGAARHAVAAFSPGE